MNYLVKPFTTRQLADRLTAYARSRALLEQEPTLGQQDVDRAFRLLPDQDRDVAPKGRSSATATLLARQLRTSAQAQSVAAALGTARAAQRYHADSGTVPLRPRYGATGRPEHEYSWQATENS